MIRAVTVECDWPGCRETIAFNFVGFLYPEPHHGWKSETRGASMHLCPKHKRKAWHEVQEASFRASMATVRTTPEK